MSDFGRKPVSEQIGQAVKPESQKTTGEKISNTVSGAADRVGSAVQPNSQKSNSQAAADSFRGGKDDAQKQGEGLVATVQDYANSAVEGAKKVVDSALEAASNATGGNNSNVRK